MIITIPLYIFLFIYFGFLIIFFTFVGINFWHILKSGTLTTTNFVVSILAAAATVVVLTETYYLLNDVNWQQTITLFDLSWFASALPESTF